MTSLTRKQLLNLAGGRSFDRGETYFDEGRVTELDEDAGLITAIVTGQNDYQIALQPGMPKLKYSCDCPVGEDGDFCKHLVAAGLAWIKLTKAQAGRPETWRTQQKTITGFLGLQDKPRLIDLIVQAAKANREFRQELLLDAARLDPEKLDLAAFRRMITAATRTGGYVEYHKARAYARGLNGLVRSIRALFEDGHAVAVIELTEFALQKLETAIGEVDDSAEFMRDVLDDLQELHHRACAEARPEPLALARRIFEWEITSDWEIFANAEETYADIFDEEGSAEYERLTKAAWEKLPPLGSDAENRHIFDSSRFRLTKMMESLARQSGDTEALVAVKRHDLTHAFDYLQIAEIYREADETEKAIEWAQKGLAAFPKRDSRLVHFLADQYHRLSRHDEAIELIWGEFAASSTLLHYQHLADHALRTKPESVWEIWRDRALSRLRDIIAETKAEEKSSGNPDSPWRSIFQIDHSALVEIFLWEQRNDEAWQEAVNGGCSDSLWIRVAATRGIDHPADALPVFQRMIAPLVSRTNQPDYEAALILIRKIGELMVRLDQGAEFDQYTRSLRMQFKIKRNFIKLLDAYERQIPPDRAANRLATAVPQNLKMFEDVVE